MPNRFVTISVDDGHVTDCRTAELLLKHGLQATFYIPTRNPERPVMPTAQIRELSNAFEIGAHTLNHVSLSGLPDSEAWEEISGSKEWLENTIGKPAVSFCYPRGKYNSSTPALIEKAGFSGARTCFFNLHSFPSNPFLWGVSTHAYCHSKAIQVRHAILERNFAGMWNFMRTYKGTTDWQRHFLYALDHVERYGGIAHLYLHSWEIDEMRQWDRLETILGLIAERSSFTSVTNGTLFRLWKGEHEHRRN
jgi:peptidoglycan/xylan/chitin deacetylase (PgdA/CDA1 family)